jgi:hypothetical protein
VLDSIEWQSLSVILINHILREDKFDNFTFGEFNVIFKEHFFRLNRDENESVRYIDFFDLLEIIDRCDGKKSLDGRLWEGYEERYYVSGMSKFTIGKTFSGACEGRPWKKVEMWNSETGKKLNESLEFYSCRNTVCFKRADKFNHSRSYLKWNLMEILEVFNLSVDKAMLAFLAGWVNRMNQIIVHLQCRDCSAFLRPLPFEAKTLGFYAVPLFHCVNKGCRNKEIIRFTHCSNKRCASHINNLPLDSRDCKSCNPKDKNHIGLKCSFCGESCPKCNGFTPRIVVENW